VKIRYTENILEIDRENPGFLRKRRTLNQKVVGSNPGDGTAWYL
jgi:hypothetical protein